MAVSFLLVIDCAEPEPLARVLGPPHWDTCLNRFRRASPAGMRTGATWPGGFLFTRYVNAATT